MPEALVPPLSDEDPPTSVLPPLDTVPPAVLVPPVEVLPPAEELPPVPFTIALDPPVPVLGAATEYPMQRLSDVVCPRGGQQRWGRQFGKSPSGSISLHA